MKIIVVLLLMLVISVGMLMIVVIDNQEDTKQLFPIVCVGGIVYFEKTLTPRFDRHGSVSKCNIGSVYINDITIE